MPPEIGVVVPNKSSYALKDPRPIDWRFTGVVVQVPALQVCAVSQMGTETAPVGAVIVHVH